MGSDPSGTAPWDTHGVPAHPAAKDMVLRLRPGSTGGHFSHFFSPWMAAKEFVSDQYGPTCSGGSQFSRTFLRPRPPLEETSGLELLQTPLGLCSQGRPGSRAACLPPGWGLHVWGPRHPPEGWMQRTGRGFRRGSVHSQGAWCWGGLPPAPLEAVEWVREVGLPQGEGAAEQAGPCQEPPHVVRGEGVGLGCLSAVGSQRHAGVCSRPDPGLDGVPALAVTPWGGACSGRTED